MNAKNSIDNKDELKMFMQRLLKIMPKHNDIFSNGIPGYGAVNIGADPAQNLQKAALQFADAYRDIKLPPEAVNKLAYDLEGTLMVAATFEIVTEKNLDELLETLRHLMQSIEKRVE
jgi:hypothetical protein